ncbi:MAG: T9SS type B sorting domain-containing protein [Saprospiraceae bacterium]|nr:T9SS type B sorting domain-containing protein [Saprospiraceae bacterium]
MPSSLKAGYFSSDTIPPQVDQPPQDIVVSCSTTLNVDSLLTVWYNNFGGMLATDDQSDTIIYNADPDLNTTLQLFNDSAGCDNEKSVAVRFRAIDDCDNSTEEFITSFTIEDNSGPDIITQAAPMMVHCGELVKDSLELWILTQGGAIATDDCSESIDWFRFTYSDNLGNAGVGFIGANVIPIPDNICNWSVNVSFIVIDGCGNQSVTTSFFEVVDDVAPVFSEMPSDTVVGCEALPLPNGVTAIDYCTSSPGLQYDEEIIREGTPDDCSYYNYTLIRTWEAEDACGNMSTHVQNVTIMDNQPPQFFLLDTVVIECNVLNEPNADFLPTNIIDNCSSVTINNEDVQNGEGCNYTIDRTYTFRDICGNISRGIQHIIVEDNTPPEVGGAQGNQIFSCQSDFIPSFEEWYTQFDDNLIIEDCNAVNTFVAIPGTYDPNDVSTFPGTPPSELDLGACGTSAEGFLTYAEVDFVFFDICENVTVINAAYGIVDDTPPQILSCIEDAVIEAEPGDCMASFTLPELSIQDDCVETTSEIVLSTSTVLSSTEPGSPDAIVNFIRTTFNDINPFFLDISGNVLLDIQILNADIDGPSEVFVVTTETLDTLGFTQTSSVQCGSSLSSFQINGEDIISWLNDGSIDFFLFPFVPDTPSDAINDICDNNRIHFTLTIPTNNDDLFSKEIMVNGLRISEQLIDGDQINLEVGLNLVDLIVSDCGGNKDSCSFQVTVVDTEIPSITCLSDTTLILSEDQCTFDFIVTTPVIVTDNCFLNKVYDQKLPLTDEGSFLTFEFLDDFNAFTAQNVFFSFDQVFSINHSIEDAILEISILCHLEDGSDRIEVKGEDGSTLGFMDEGNITSCEASAVSFNITSDQINEWASDGRIDISFIPLKGIGVSSGGINPCDSIDSDGPDGVSFLNARLKYSDVELSYVVEGATSIDTTVAMHLDSLELDLNTGDNVVSLIAYDKAGNENACSFTISIADTISPQVFCRNAVLFLDPSGINEVELTPSSIDNGSFDNCGIDSMAVEPSAFGCESLGQQVEVIFTVWDESGNSSSCVTEVMLRTEVLNPTFEIGVCGNDTLKLFANAPPSDIEDVYTFLWTGPDFTSNQENPIIPNASPNNNGTYTLEITGFNGCISAGTVEVNVEEISSPTIITESSNICAGDQVLLTTTSQNGDIAYNWYEGVFPNGLLIETTEAPSLQISPSRGDHLYYLVVNLEGCDSNPSPAVSISVVEAPTASVIDEFVTVCEGEFIVIGTDVSGLGIEYLWTGPNGFTSDQQFPDTIFDANTSDEGIYNLVINVGSCISDTAGLQVTLFDKPVTPEIVSGDVFCEGSSISLSVNNIPNADLYIWFQDGVQSTTTTRNTLLIDNASEEISGDWTVVVNEGICESDPSEPQSITVESELLISANNDGPGCEGDSIQLTTSFVPGGNYSWTGPQGFTSNIQNPKVPALAGEYFVEITTPSGCDGESSTTVEIITPPEITALSSDALECMDGITDIKLFPSVFPQGDYRYEWTGIGIEDTTAIQAVIPDATENDNGTYTLKVYDGTCASEERQIEIDITGLPPTPDISGKTGYCTGDTLMIDAISDIEGSFYVWNTPQGQRFTEQNRLIIPDIQLEDIGSYNVVIERGNCRSLPSDNIDITVTELSLAPSVSANDPICPGDTLKLFSTTLRDASYSWTGPNDFISEEQNPIIPVFTSDLQGEYTVTVSIGSCIESSQPYTVQLSQRPIAPQPEHEEYSLCSSFIGQGIELCIDQEFYISEFSYEVYLEENNGFITSFNSRCVRLENLNELNIGDNFIYLESNNGSCSSAPSSLININVLNPPLVDAEAEENPIFVCDDNPVTLTSVFGPPEVDLTWDPLDDNISLEYNGGRSSSVSNLKLGENKILLAYGTEACGIFTSDTIRVFLDEAPTAVNDNYSFSEANEMLLPVFDNDFVPASSEVKITRQPQFGSVTVERTGINLNPASGFIGTINFTYEICGLVCEGLCDEATVIVSLGDVGDCVAPTIITPNGDGVNDVFVVPCLYSGVYPESQLTIFNQWGTTVYGSTDYKNDWNGTYNDKDLPVGTYYYILNLNDGSEPLYGFLIIER